MPELQQIANTYAALFGALIVINLISAPFATRAARRKNRSFATFLILALVLGPVITGLEVAKLAFSDSDPRSPLNKKPISIRQYFGI